MARASRTKLLILGFGGHARSIGDVALAFGYRHLLFLDANARAGESFAGFAAVATLPDDLQGDWLAFPASGSASARATQCENAPYALVELIAPTASVGTGTVIGLASFVGHHAHVGPLARIGTGAILNTGSIVEHECSIGDFTHVSVNATVAGRCRIGSRVMIGAGATVIDGISVCDDVIIGAGAVVVADISARGTYVGVPARRVG